MQTAKVIHVVGCHAEGEVGDVIVGGVAPPPGETVWEQSRWIARDQRLRNFLLNEPRGGVFRHFNLLVPAKNPQAQMGWIIMEPEDTPPMSGSNSICVVTVLLETGILQMVEPVTELTLEAPAGLIRVRADCKDGKVTRVRFRNVPSFALHLDAEIKVEGHGTARVDVAWGGMFYVIADASQFGLDLTPENGAEMVRLCEALRRAARDQLPVTHPENPAITGPTISQLTGPAQQPGNHGRSAVTVSNSVTAPPSAVSLPGALDRSPCGTGTSAKLACPHARGLLDTGVDYINEGPIGTTFTARIEGLTQVGPYPAIIPSIAGQAWIYGTSQYLLDPTDPFQQGFRVGDIWG